MFFLRRKRLPADLKSMAMSREGSAMANFRGICAFGLAAGLVLTASCALAEGDFPLEGVYTQNEPCRGDGSKQEFLRVKVTPQEVSYAGGNCSIDDKQQDGDKIAMRVTCKFASGAVMGSAITFTKKDNNTFAMAQVEGTYKAVLHRCPG
jgi:hypothetical protein